MEYVHKNLYLNFPGHAPKVPRTVREYGVGLRDLEDIKWCQEKTTVSSICIL